MTRGAGRGHGTVPKAANPAAVVVDRIGQELLVEPGCADVLASLRTARHALVRDGRGGWAVAAVPEPLGTVDDHPCGPRPYYPAGLEPVILRLLAQAGCRVARTGDRAVTLPAPEPPDGRGPHPVDAALLDFVHRHERGLVRYDGRSVDPARLVAQLRLGFPAARIAVAVERREDLWRFGRCLKAIIPGATVADDRSPGPAGPLVVATFLGLGADGVDLHRRDILVVLDAPEALSQYARLALPGAPRARLYGLLDGCRRLAPYDQDRLRALFGLDEVVVPRHGFSGRPVEVVAARVAGGPAVAADADVVRLERQAIWLNPVRNRRLARLAAAVAAADRGRVAAECPALAGRLGDIGEPGVVVLVENVEHALALAMRLPGWPVVTGADVVTAGLSHRRLAALGRRRWTGGGIPAHMVATFAGLDVAGPVEPGVVVRADGGVGVPEALAACRNTRNTPTRPLVLVDADDRHHPELRRRARRRRESYAALGWAVAGGGDAADAIGRFLAARPGRRP